MIEHDFDEEFVPIAAELQRLPYFAPSRDFADRVIAGIDRLQSSQGLDSIGPSRHLELHQGGQRQAVVPGRRGGVVRGTLRAGAGVALVATAAFMFFEIDVLTAILSVATAQYGLAILGVGTQVGALVLGADTIAYLQAGALQSVLLYLTLAIGLFGGYGAIRTAAYIAKRKAA
jgi:hypothetical protein